MTEKDLKSICDEEFLEQVDRMQKFAQLRAALEQVQQFQAQLPPPDTCISRVYELIRLIDPDAAITGCATGATALVTDKHGGKHRITVEVIA